MKTFLIGSTKGGTGKSTLSVCLAQCAVHRKVKCLLVDLDSQADSTFMSDGNSNSTESAVELLQYKKVTPEHTRFGYDLIPGRVDLGVMNLEGINKTILSDSLPRYKNDYDICFLDAPPTTSNLLINGISAANELIIPTKTSGLEFKDLQTMFELAKMFQRPPAINLKVAGVVVNCYNPRTLISRQIFELTKQLAEKYNAPILGTVRETTAVRECCALKRSIFLAKNKVIEDYLNIFDQLDF